MRIIGLTGFAGSGKDEAAKVLIKEFGFKRVAFADPMRDALYKLDPIVGYRSLSGQMVSVRDLVDKEGWDNAKRDHPEIRRLLQVFGTECGREIHGENCWVDAAFRQVEYPHDYVFTDVRFPNEAERIHGEGGMVLNIHRPGVASVNGHISDKGLPSELIDCTLCNDGTLEDLASAVRALVTTGHHSALRSYQKASS